ncbi:MAG: hypothetical protein EOP49_07270 [Sphingobacteriales bacterium]|nr:MAG: hypothetical protein EOP49_07270 [Sphingobacteriales bacterium]
MKKNFLIALLSCLSMIGLFSCSQPQQLTYQDAKNFRVGKLSLAQPEIGMDLQFYNPNAFGLTMKDANIEVYINNQFIGKATMNREFSVPARDTFLMPVYLTADIKNVFPNALQILFNKTVDLQLKGNVRAGKGVFLNVPINYQGRQKLNVF